MCLAQAGAARNRSLTAIARASRRALPGQTCLQVAPPRARIGSRPSAGPRADEEVGVHHPLAFDIDDPGGLEVEVASPSRRDAFRDLDASRYTV